MGSNYLVAAEQVKIDKNIQFLTESWHTPKTQEMRAPPGSGLKTNVIYRKEYTSFIGTLVHASGMIINQWLDNKFGNPSSTTVFQLNKVESNQVIGVLSQRVFNFLYRYSEDNSDNEANFLEAPLTVDGKYVYIYI